MPVQAPTMGMPSLFFEGGGGGDRGSTCTVLYLILILYLCVAMIVIQNLSKSIKTIIVYKSHGVCKLCVNLYTCSLVPRLHSPAFYHNAIIHGVIKAGEWSLGMRLYT